MGPKTSKFVYFNGKRIGRDNATVSYIKILRSFKCQICGRNIRKRDGSLHVEGAHITEKKSSGPEIPSNILILCPNHHKEFDLGEREIIERDDNFIRFVMNGTEYRISLTI